MKSTAVLASALGCCAWACANLHPGPARAALPGAEIYQRATNQVARADFFKPAERKTNDLASTLAPLILQELAGAREPRPPPDQFGTLVFSNGAVLLDPLRPAIYWQADTVPLNGKAHTRLSYVWFYSPGSHAAGRGHGTNDASAGGAESGLPAQGVRLTLNSAGQPVIWEVLADTSGAELIFVSQNLEAAAAAQFGKALPGRRYAIERSQVEAPNVIIPRLLDDGPVPMGPILYLSARTRDAGTIICRCMAAQVKALRTTATYDLLPLDAARANSLVPQSKPPAKAPAALWPSDPPSATRLARCLRLPPF